MNERLIYTKQLVCNLQLHITTFHLLLFIHWVDNAFHFKTKERTAAGPNASVGNRTFIRPEVLDIFNK